MEVRISSIRPSNCYCTVWCGAVDYMFRFGSRGIMEAFVYNNDEDPVAPIREERY